MSEILRRPIPQLLVMITEIDRRGVIADYFRGTHVRVIQFRGRGTATSEIIDMLGLADTGKAVSIGVIPKQISRTLLRELQDLLHFDRAGGGLAFTLPCSGIVSPLLHVLEEETRTRLRDHMENEVNIVSEHATHDLIVAIINQGYSEELVEAAKACGATGGTVIHASQVNEMEKARSWGITLHQEKEIVVLLVKRGEKAQIMKALSKRCGVATEARGLILSLPVDEVEGL